MRARGSIGEVLMKRVVKHHHIGPEPSAFTVAMLRDICEEEEEERIRARLDSVGMPQCLDHLRAGPPAVLRLELLPPFHHLVDEFLIEVEPLMRPTTAIDVEIAFYLYSYGLYAYGLYGYGRRRGHRVVPLFGLAPAHWLD